MNNVINNLQGFLRNKNIVTIVGVILIIGILYWGYNRQIERQVRPLRNIPVAKEQILPGTLITDEMIDYVDISPIVFNHGDVAQHAGEVVGKYSDYNTVIHAGSLFYRDALIDEEDLPASVFTKIKDGDVVHRFRVTTETTYGNSIFPGNKIDMYMKVVIPTTREIMVGKLIENIEVIAVKDSTGKDVFSRRDDGSQPAMLIFGLEPKLHNLMLKASYLTEFSVELIPVPHGGTIEQVGETRVSSEELRMFIDAFTVPNPEFMTDGDVEIDDLIIDDNDEAADSLYDMLYGDQE